jgi:hypothetical protein
VNNEFECGRKWSWPNLRYYPGIHLEVLINTMKESGSLATELKYEPRSYEYEAGVLTT